MPKYRSFPRNGRRRSSSHGCYTTARTSSPRRTGWEQYSKEQLADLCRDRRLNTTGNKFELINRLEKFIASKNAEAASAAKEKEMAAERETEAAMVDALAWVEQNQKMAPEKNDVHLPLSQSTITSSQTSVSSPQRNDLPSSQSSILSQSSASSPRKSTLTQEQREMIERKRQAALLKRQNSLSSYSSVTLSQSSNISSPTRKRSYCNSDALGSSPVINPYAKPSAVASPSRANVATSPRRQFQSPPSSVTTSPTRHSQSITTQPVLPPLPPNAPPIRQYSLDKLSDMQLKVIEAARPPTAASLSASINNAGLDQKSQHPIVRVTAAAGTGKTTTLLHLALRCIDLGHKDLTYVTYSKASAVDAQTRIQALLPDDKKSCIKASTLHSCAMSVLSNQPLETEETEMRGLIFEDKFRRIIEEVCGDSIESYLRETYRNIAANTSKPKEEKRKRKKAYDQVIFWLTKSFNSFCIKDISLERLKDESNSFRHYYPLTIRVFKKGEVADKLGFPIASYSKEESYKFFADQCVVLWEHIIENGIRTFDTEVKRAQLNGVRIPGSVLLVDECQDLDACQVDLIAKQLQYGTAIFFVGDAAQTIYSFRGAKSSNYMSLPNAIDMCLNKSWRFGPSIARIANVPLFAKENSPQTNNYLSKQRKEWLPYRIEGARGEEESSILTDSLIGKSKELGTITFVARTNFALMFKAMEIMGLGFLADRQKDEVDCNSDEESSDMPDEPVKMQLVNVPKFHINGDGDLSGLKRWKRASKEIRYLFTVYEARGTGVEIKLPEKVFPDFSNRGILWDELIEDVQNLELNKYVQPLQIISKYGKNTIKALEAFEDEVLNKKYPADEADVILTTCHAAKGLEWDHVEICDDFIDLATRSYKQNAPMKVRPHFLSTEVSSEPRSEGWPPKLRYGWQLNLQAYGDDINLLYVACTRAKKTLVVPQSVKNFFADVDLVHYLIKDMMKAINTARKKVPGTELKTIWEQTKDEPSTYTSLNKKSKNDGRLTKEELWNLYFDLCKPLRDELGITGDDGILNSLFPGYNTRSDSDDCDAKETKLCNPAVKKEAS